MRAFLSIDWDYFVRSLYAWDWGHQESAFYMSGGMWEIRMSSLLANGLDITQEMDPARWSNPRPWTFWSILDQLGYDFSFIGATKEILGSENFVVADSHAVAGPVFNGVAEELGPPDIIINFDAHHDMGYGSKSQVDAMVKSGQVDCAMWLRALASRFPETNISVIYPDWRLEEFPISEERKALKEVLPSQVLKRTKIGSFTDKDGSISKVAKPSRKIEVEALFICRSSAWTPPWLDSQFIEFVESIEDYVSDPPFEYAPERLGHIHVLECREDFSAERARAMAEQMKQLMQGHKPR
jgi:hypothetical protein